MIKNLKDDFFIQKQHFYYNIELSFDKNFILIDYKTNEISISIDKTNIEKCLKTLEKFFINNNYEGLMVIFKKVFTNLSKHLIVVFEIINKHAKVNVRSEKNKLKIELEEANRIQNDDNESTDDDDDLNEEKTFKTIEGKFTCLEKIIEYLNQNLFELDLDFKASEGTINDLFKTEFKMMFLDSFFKFIYENLILKSIKLREFDITKMLRLCNLINEFEKFLNEKRINLINDSTASKYENLLFKSFKLNIDNIYIKKKCKYLLNKARKLMKVKTDLFETSLISEEHEASKVTSISILNSENILFESNDFSNNFLKFNKCKISLLTVKFIQVVYETLNEATKFEKLNEENCKNENELYIKLMRNVSLLCLTAKNIIDLYSYIMPVFYKDEFQNLPLIAGRILID